MAGGLGPAFKCRGGGYSEDPSRCPGGVEGVLPAERRVRLSKLMSGILRHFPEAVGLRLDEHGWVGVRELYRAIRARPGYEWLEPWHIEAVALLDPKGRFELGGGRIRARYGHSVRVKVEPLPGVAPPRLYHGTVRARLPSIMERGLLPMKRLYVHLSATPEQAVEVGSRHGPDVVVLEVDVECLRRRGLEPRRASHSVYVVEWVPPECIRLLPGPYQPPP